MASRCDVWLTCFLEKGELNNGGTARGRKGTLLPNWGSLASIGSSQKKVELWVPSRLRRETGLLLCCINFDESCINRKIASSNVNFSVPTMSELVEKALLCYEGFLNPREKISTYVYR
jgi:hypothetical protein